MCSSCCLAITSSRCGNEIAIATTASAAAIMHQGRLQPQTNESYSLLQPGVRNTPCKDATILHGIHSRQAVHAKSTGAPPLHLKISPTLHLRCTRPSLQPQPALHMAVGPMLFCCFQAAAATKPLVRHQLRGTGQQAGTPVHELNIPAQRLHTANA